MVTLSPEIGKQFSYTTLNFLHFRLFSSKISMLTLFMVTYKSHMLSSFFFFYNSIFSWPAFRFRSFVLLHKVYSMLVYTTVSMFSFHSLHYILNLRISVWFISWFFHFVPLLFFLFSLNCLYSLTIHWVA